jgi:hypothetical protein
MWPRLHDRGRADRRRAGRFPQLQGLRAARLTAMENNGLNVVFISPDDHCPIHSAAILCMGDADPLRGIFSLARFDGPLIPWRPADQFFEFQKWIATSAVLVATEFTGDVLDPSTDFFDRRLDFVFWHVESFGPVQQFVVLIDVDAR